jgi:hypothetical protein
MTAPIASGWSEFAGWGLHPLESAAFARRTPIRVIAIFRFRLIPNRRFVDTVAEFDRVQMRAGVREDLSRSV